MARTNELPELVSEFVGLSKEYLQQETIEPAKRLGRFAGYSFGGAALFALGAFFLGIAVTRFLLALMPGDPSHRMWTGLGYVAAALVIGAAAAVIAGLTQRGGSE